MAKTQPITPHSERRFLELKGDFTESVKVTVDPNESSDLNGWYVFERTAKGENRFFRKPADSKLIQVVRCETKYLQFDRNLGILPNSHYYKYEPVGPRNGEEYACLRDRLLAVEEWRE